MKTSCFILTIVATMGLQASHVSANTMFSDDFTGGACANWANPNVADYTSDNAAFTGYGDYGRNYLRTVDADYGTEDFVATVDLTNGAITGSMMSFFGLGTGTPSSYYGEPQNGSFVYVRFNAQGFTDYYMHAVNSSSDPYSTSAFEPNLPADTIIRVSLCWEAATSRATFKVDTDYDGTFDDTYSVVNEELSAAGTTTRLFIGGAGGITTDNFSVSAFLPGDADNDGDVDDDDAAILASNWQTASGATWSMGDFNHDGYVDDIDATILATNWENAVVSVPEPSIFVILSIGLLGLLVGTTRSKSLR